MRTFLLSVNFVKIRPNFASPKLLSCSARRTPNFTNPKFQFPKFMVLQSDFIFNITSYIGPIDHFGTEHFGKSHIGTDVSSREHFCTCTVWRCGLSGRWTFLHRNVLTWSIFGRGNFRRLNISAEGYFGT